MARFMLPRITLAIACILLLSPALIPGVLARSDDASIAIHLRRATFDPLQTMPSVATTMKADDSSQLRLVQLSSAPTATTEATLEAAGMHPLLYIPDNTYLVRVNSAAVPNVAALRWSGRFETAYKLPATLDSLFTSTNTTTHTLRLLAAPDSNVATVVAAVQNAGGSVIDQAITLNGGSLRITIPEAALRGLLQRDDVLWVEPATPLHLLNDKARAIIGVTEAQQQFSWLDGTGQIVAVADTGLDLQNSLSADFSGRVVTAFTPQQMSNSCRTTTWSDYEGHGTHVSGSVLGSGTLSPTGTSFAGVAPGAKLVVEAIASSNSGGSLDCLTEDSSFLSKAYNAGARVQNASWGGSTGSSDNLYGGYDSFAQLVDDYLWQHKDHLLVVAAGNQGEDSDFNGVIDSDSISSPATAKNVLAVGASENDRPPSSSTCATTTTAPSENYCYRSYFSSIDEPFANDFISDNPDGIVAFSSRGPTDDGRIKPEIVAPGSNIISSRSHAAASNAYDALYNNDYAYSSGTSMASPIIAGSAALVRQWLAQERSTSTPSAALIKALLLNGATNLTPGQYGTGTQREIPTTWPNNVEGWGRASIADTIGMNADEVWFRDEASGLTTGKTSTYTLNLAAGQSLHLTLAWTDYPGAIVSSKTLVNDLDLEIQAPNGTVLKGNAAADLPTICRSNGADRCNNIESIDVSSAQEGIYTLRVRGTTVARGPQPFALVATRGKTNTVPPIDTPVLQGTAKNAALSLNWTSVISATSYEVQRAASANFANAASTTITTTMLTTVVEQGTYVERVRGCNSAGCGPWSNIVTLTSTVPPRKTYLPQIQQN